MSGGRAPHPPREEAAALLVLQALPGVGDRTVARLRGRFGSGVAALDAPAEAFARVAGPRAEAARSDPDRARRAREGLEAARRLGARVAVVGGDDYPPRLLHLPDPPPVLFLRGDTGLASGRCVAVVGSRRATPTGRRTAGAIAGALARAGVPVASGLALGIDGAAHAGCLEAGGRTTAVLGTGPDQCHPRSHLRLQRRIARDGLLISEFVPGTPALPHHFPRRNRILAALSDAVVVVEAADRSGALITAAFAADLGREVFAVPGGLDRRQSGGANALIRDGARILLSPDQLLEELTWTRPPEATLERAGPTGLPEDLAAVWRALGEGPGPADDVARRSGLDPARTLAALTGLELGGWAVRDPGMRFARLEGGA